MKVGIIGTGSFGLSLARQIYKKHKDIKIWGYDKDEVETLNTLHINRNLPGVIFEEGIKASGDIKEVVEDRDIVLHVTPSAYAKKTFYTYVDYLKKDAKVIICSKGFDFETMKLPYHIFAEKIPNTNIGVLTGPTHAEELARDIKTAIVSASLSNEVNEMVTSLFDSNILRVYKTNDIVGAEVGGALKNIIAFCAGILVGLNEGDNTFAALCTRGLVEIERFAKKIGAKDKTIYGLSGLGDLIVTCSSKHSRNRRAGILLAQGKNIEQIREEIGMVIESIDNIEVAKKLSDQLEVEMPIVNAVYAVLFENKNIQSEMEKLMNRALREE